MMDAINGRGRVGPTAIWALSAWWPLCGLRVDNEKIIFTLWPVEYILTKGYIVDLVVHSVFGMPYVRIVHANPRFEKWVLFGVQPARWNQLTELLSKNGFSVKPEGTTIHEPKVAYSPIIRWLTALILFFLGWLLVRGYMWGK